ncbi:MAG TPA: ABC transporter substrate-binding protein [Trebonia sp.]|nr:ABC transporter substrate-binding protein [Trebonia sp.]
MSVYVRRNIPSRKFFASAAAAAALSLLVGACSSSSTPNSTSAAATGGTLTVAFPNAVDALDPTTDTTFVGRIVFANMCQGLYGINAQEQVTPVLAASPPTITDGGLLYTIHLRSGVKFNDGTAFDAQAVKTSLERDKTLPTSARAVSLKSVQSIDVVNSSTVQLHLSQPYSPLSTVLAGRAGIVMSPTALAKEGTRFSQDPVCVGPYAFQSRPSLNQINLVASKYYFGGAPKLSKLVFTVITSPATCYADLLSGAINVAAPGCLAPNDYQLLTTNSAYVAQSLVSPGYEGIDINVTNGAGYTKPATAASNPLATHPTLREALALTLDRNTINQVVFQGINKPGCGPISPLSPYYTKLSCSGPNIAEAKKLVAASGVPTPINLTLMVPTGSLNVQQGEVIASEAKAAGFNISIQPTEFTTALSSAGAGNYQLFDIGWSGRVDPDQDTTAFYSQGSALDYTGQGPSSIMTPLAAADRTTVTAQRKALYYQAEQAMIQWGGIIYLFHTTNQVAYAKNITGVSFTPDGLLHFASAAIG